MRNNWILREQVDVYMSVIRKIYIRDREGIDKIDSHDNSHESSNGNESSDINK